MKKLTRKQFIEAYNRFSCVQWRTEIENILISHPLATDEMEIEIPPHTLALIEKAATAEQKRYIKKLGLEFESDNNAFLKNFEDDETEIEALSKKLFGDFDTLQILRGQTPKDRPELRGRAFYVYKEWNVELIKTLNGGSAIVITKN